MSFEEILELLKAFSSVFVFLGIGLGGMLVFYIFGKISHKREYEAVMNAAQPYPVTVHARLTGKVRSYVLGDYKYYAVFLTDQGQKLKLLTDIHGYHELGRFHTPAPINQRRHSVGMLTYENGRVTAFELDGV